VIQRYPHKLEYKPGKDNVGADALSRGWHVSTEGGGNLRGGGDVMPGGPATQVTDPPDPTKPATGPDQT